LGFATARAGNLVLVGCTETKLNEVESTIAAISQSTNVSLHVADVTNDAAVKTIAEIIGTWDSILHCAGYMDKPAPALVADIGDYWKAFEVSARQFPPTSQTLI
jgi:NADP-dependent 3-hydroxy acid dehydrogenase YdfG